MRGAGETYYEYLLELHTEQGGEQIAFLISRM
jgi:hypothetical protein